MAQSRSQAARIAPTRASHDLGALGALVGALALIGGAIALGGSWIAFVDLPAILIVGGGTFAVTAVSFGPVDVVRAQALVARSLRRSVPEAREIAHNILRIAAQARRDGALSLQGTIRRAALREFLRRGLTLVVDGTPGEEAERTMRREADAIADRHYRASSVLRRAAEVAPAMGLIGTLVGLVQMLANLEDPASIGPGMAVALLTTFYGAILANVVLTPLVTKLERQSEEEALVNELCVLGVGSIGRQENPRRLETTINTLLPPSQRIAFFTA